MTRSFSHPGTVPDRRNRKRYFTKQNFLRATLVLIVGFAGYSLYSEHRGNKSEDYGRLYERRTRHGVQTVRPTIEVVTEEAPLKEGRPDPLLLDGIKREQYLGVDETALGTAGLTPQTSTSEPVMDIAKVDPLGSGDGMPRKKARLTMYQGPNGVEVRKN